MTHVRRCRMPYLIKFDQQLGCAFIKWSGVFSIEENQRFRVDTIDNAAYLASTKRLHDVRSVDINVPVLEVQSTARVFQPTTGPSQYEVSYPSYEGAVCAQESLSYILGLGVDNIRDHARGLTDRLHDELPKLGYASITPRHNDSPIVSFVAPEPAAAMEKLRAAGVHVAMRFGDKMRISPSVYNNQDDITRLLEALA